MICLFQNIVEIRHPTGRQILFSSFVPYINKLFPNPVKNTKPRIGAVKIHFYEAL